MRTGALWLLGLFPWGLTACGSPPEPGPAPIPAPRVWSSRPPRTPREVPWSERDLGQGWDTLDPLDFEALVDEIAGVTAPFRWSATALDHLALGLDRQDGVSVRAAVLLAHSRHDSVVEVLMARLEKREAAPARPLDAGDLVAAAALEGRAAANAPARLESLATGENPHPILNVRVECARVALRGGRAGVAPFLLRVLRALTPAELTDPGDWERITTMAWAKSRAAEALSQRAGVPCVFRADGSWDDQMAEADRLEGLLGG